MGEQEQREDSLLVYYLEDSVLNVFQVCSCVSSLSARDCLSRAYL